MSDERSRPNRVKAFRQNRGWTQEELSRHAGVPRPSISAIEIQRLAPSVDTALALAEALGCQVEDLFGPERPEANVPVWAWEPERTTCRYWLAHVAGKDLHFPVEPTSSGILPHDGVFREGQFLPREVVDSRRTLVAASCDPAAGLLADEYRRACGFRLIVLSRSSRQSLALLEQGRVDVAGLHLATPEQRDGNVHAVRTIVGSGCSLLSVAEWQEGIAVAPGFGRPTLASLLRTKARWIGRETGTAARQCQDEILGDRPAPRKTAKNHREVVDAIRGGWAEAGVCLKLVCEEAGMGFVPIRRESYDVCFRESERKDPRIVALIDVIRSHSFRRLLTDLPGYDPTRAGELIHA